MSSGDSMSACTVCGQVGHWESSHAGDAARVQLLQKLLTDLVSVCLCHDFNEHWDAYKEAAREIVK